MKPKMSHNETLTSGKTNIAKCTFHPSNETYM